MGNGALACVLAAVLPACHRSAPPASPHPPAAPLADTAAITALRADLVLSIERDAPAIQNACGAGRYLVSAARDARGDVARRLRERLRAKVIAELGMAQPACAAGTAARLIPLLGDAEQRAIIADLARLYEKGLNGYALYAHVMPAIAPYLTPDEVHRFARAVAPANVHGCVRRSVLAALADAGRLPPAGALAAMKEGRDLRCLDFDQLGVLRFADAATIRALYPDEMALLDEPPARFGLEHVRALALLAPYLETKRRPALLAAAFRAMPSSYDRSASGNPWGELPPEAHFFWAIERLGPLVDAGLVDAALGAIPPTWPADSRTFATAQVAAALPAPLRRARVPGILAAMPAPERGEVAAAARLELASDLPSDAVRDALDVVVQHQNSPRERALVIARALRALPPSSQPEYAARVRAVVADTEYADSRVTTAGAVLDLLAGVDR